MGANFVLGAGLRTQFINASPEHADISSTRVRAALAEGSDVQDWVPVAVLQTLRSRLDAHPPAQGEANENAEPLSDLKVKTA